MDNENTNNVNYQKFITLKTLKDFLDKCDNRYTKKAISVDPSDPPTITLPSTISATFDPNIGSGQSSVFLGNILGNTFNGGQSTPPKDDGDDSGSGGSSGNPLIVSPNVNFSFQNGGFLTEESGSTSTFENSIATKLKFDNISTIHTTSFANMFNNCQNLKQLDITCFDTSKATTMANMFSVCPQLKSIDVLGFNTANVTSMANMFAGDTSLESIDLTNFDLRIVRDLSNMFNGCTNLKEITFGNGFKYGFSNSRATAVNSNVKKNLDATMNCRGMFKGCSSLTSIDLSYMDPAVICVDIDSVEDIEEPTKKLTKELIYNKFISGLTIPDIDALGSADAFFAKYFINIGMFDMFEGCINLTEIKTNTNITQGSSFAFGHTPWAVGTGVDGDPNTKPVFTICNLADCHIQNSLNDLFLVNRLDYDRTHQSLFGVILNDYDFNELISLVQGRTYYQSNGARIYFDGYIVIKNDYFISPTSEIIVDDGQ